MMIIKVKKSLRNNTIGSLLLGSSTAVITPIQASQRALSLAEKEILEMQENRK
ncbi:MAG: hypothetical protein LBF34_00560 [Puniceicoccales bacterium]|jgi:hypothetical protein|nr:hypothetical protein [Puniceicoccales bacterium]